MEAQQPTYDELQTRVKQLAKKCNTLLDHIKKTESSQEQPTPITRYINEFCAVVDDLLKNDVFYQPKKVTATSRKFRIAAAKEFKEYMGHRGHDEAEIKELFAAWAAIGLIDSDEQGKTMSNYTMDGKAVRCVKVNRAVVEMVQAAAKAGASAGEVTVP